MRWSTRPEGTGYKWRNDPGHPLADTTGKVRVHRAVLYEALGPGEHPCNWCGAPLHWHAIHDTGSRIIDGALFVDHLDRNPRNNDLANLVPACHRCNVWRNPPRPMIPDDQPVIVYPSGARLRAVGRVCEQCGKDFLARISSVKMGRGRYCSHACAALRR